MKGTPASLAKPAARKAAATIPCNVQAPIRRVGRTDWMEAALMLVSVVYEVESAENVGRQHSWQQPIYFDDIHRYGRYIAGAKRSERCGATLSSAQRTEQPLALRKSPRRDEARRSRADRNGWTPAFRTMRL